MCGGRNEKGKIGYCQLFESYQKAIMKINENATPVENTDDVIEKNESVISEEGADIPIHKYYKKSKVKKVKDNGDIE